MDSELSIEFVKEDDIVNAGLAQPDARLFYDQLRTIIAETGHSPTQTWQKISQGLLRPEHPYHLHQLMYYSTYRTWDSATRGPPIAWIPTPEIARQTNCGRLMESRGYELLGQKYCDPIQSFLDFQRFSVESREKYISIVLNDMGVVFNQQPHCILDTSDNNLPGGEWLPGAVLNVAECLLAAKPGRPDSSTAIVYRNEGEDDLPVRKVTLGQLRANVSRVTNALDALGFRKGDAIAIDMPMNLYAVTAYLAIVLGGYVVVSIADSFVASEIEVRLRVAKAKAIFTQDVIFRGDKTLPLYSRVVQAQAPRAIIIPARGKVSSLKLREGDMLWDDLLAQANHLSRPDEYVAVLQPIEAIVNILFSSGTTGEPKAVPWTQHTPLRCAIDGWMHLDLKIGNVPCWPTNLGWMVGPMILAASFMNGATLALYNGSPLGRGFGKFVQDAKVTMLGTVPSLVRTWKASGCMADLDWSSIRSFGSTGETSSVDDDLWLSGRGGSYKPVVEAIGGTELGGLYLGGSLLQPQAFAAFSVPGMTVEFVILDDSSNPYPDDVVCTGELALHPISMGASSTLLNADHDKIYFKGMPYFKGRQLRRHGDIFQRLPGGFYKAHGRSDDTMNLGGIKASAIEIEQVCNRAHECIQETAAIAVQPPGGGPEELVIAVTLKEGMKKLDTTELRKLFSSILMSDLNPLFKVRGVAIIPEFPRTASNKLLRRILRTECAKLLYPPRRSRL